MQSGPVSEQWQHAKLHSTSQMPAFTERIVALMQAAGFAEKDLFGMRLALEEAIVNGIVHGNRDDPAKSVEVRYRINPKEVLVEIEDQGPGFKPEEVPDPLAPENLERPDGRGIFLMRHYMTWVRFNDRGNRVNLCKMRS